MNSKPPFFRQEQSDTYMESGGIAYMARKPDGKGGNDAGSIAR